MDENVKKSLEDAGWQFGDYADFLQLKPCERDEVERRSKMQRIVNYFKENERPVFEKWAATGLLDKVPKKYKTLVAFLLENQEKHHVESKTS